MHGYVTKRRSSFVALKLYRIVQIIGLLAFPFFASGQIDSLLTKLAFETDFRFRIEQDWNSRKSDGTLRDDRTRFRYRLRTGVQFKDLWYDAGFRIRTGNQRKQQDPQLTLGEGFKEFGTLPIGIEKAYFRGHWQSFEFWMGKNTFPFNKSNELFWSDNVFPEGLFFKKSLFLNSSILNQIEFSSGHFILSASGKSFKNDAYLQGAQLSLNLFENQFKLFPAIYLFRNAPNMPDGAKTFNLDYSILHIGSRLRLIDKHSLDIEFDYYYNWQDYTKNDSITMPFQDQRTGYVIGLKYGQLQTKGDWYFTATYARLQKYSAVDIMAQNDWARWDYSAFGSPDGRLTNLQGIELVAGYALDKRTRLIMKYYLVEQLVPNGSALETGSRIRLDLDITF